MPEAAKGGEIAFLRQRRNLILLTTAILIAVASGTSISSEVKLPGIILSVAKLDVVYKSVWLIWWWFLYRYYQYYKQSGEFIVKNAFQHHIQALIHYRINQKMYVEQQGRSSSENGYRHCNSVRYLGFLRAEASYGTKIVNEKGQHDEFEWKPIDRNFYVGDFFRTLFEFTLRRSEATDYLFPLFYAIFVYIYSFYVSDWDGGLWKLIHW